MDQEKCEEMMEPLFQEFNRDADMPGTLVEDIAVLKKNELALSFIARYSDILLSVIKYCKT